MPKFDFYPSFNAGEVSPLIDARTSLEKYRSACRTLENFQILPYGGVIRRPGTQYLGTTKNPNGSEVRLIGFNFSTTTRYLIEAGVGYMRFWKPDGTLVTAASSLATAWAAGNYYVAGNYVTNSGTTYYCNSTHTSQPTFSTDLSAGRWSAQTAMEVPTPYTADILQEIQYTQVNDLIYFAHANHPPYKLSRISDTNWKFEQINFTYPPLLDQNATESVINIYPNPDTWQAGVSYLKSDYVKPPAWVASKSYAVGDIVLSGSIAYKCTVAHTSAATFVATNWAAQNQANQSFHYYALSDHRSGTNFGTDQAAGKWSQFPIPLNEMGKYSVSAGSGFFDSTKVGSQVELKWQRNLLYTEVPITGSFVSSTIAVDGSWDFQTSGTWSATVQILRTTSEVFSAGRIVATAIRNTSTNVVSVYHPFHNWNNGDTITVGDGISASYNYAISTATITVTGTHTYEYTISGNSQTGYLDIYPENITKMEIVREYTSASDRNIVTSGSEASRVGLKLRVLSHTASTGVPKARLEIATKVTGGIATVTDSGTINVDRWLGDGPRNQRNTKYFAFGAFSKAQGYPRAVALHQQRLCFGGTASQPTTIWASQIDNFENFEIGSTASDGLQFTLSASEGNRITWLYSQQNSLLTGTTGDEWVVSGADAASALSATNIEAKRQSAYGSKYMRAVLVNDVLLFIQRNGRKVRELVYEFGKDGWVAPDLTLLAEHITSGEIVEVAYQQQPDAVLWCVRGDGALIAMTYERDQKVVGWHRHLIGDAQVESVSTIYGNGTEDEVWMVVNRTISGAAYRTIERFPLLWRTRFDEQSAANYRYLDSHSNFASGAANRSITGLSRLEGKTVTVVQGESVVTRTVASESITVPAAAAGYLGLPFTSTLTPMKLDAEYEDGTSQGRKKRIHQIVVRTLKSRGGQVRTNNGDWYNLATTTTTGDQKMILAGAFGLDADVTLRQTDPYPMCVLAITPKWDAYGNE